MIVFVEDTKKQNELFAVLRPTVQQYSKPSAASKSIAKLAQEMSISFDLWDYSPKEVLSLDRKAFFDLMKQWANENPNESVLFKSVFSV